MNEPTVPGPGWTPDWQPGDELYSPMTHTHSRYLYNFRDDNEADTCACADAAHWPEPPPGHHKLTDDPLAAFITEFHASQAEEGAA